MANDSPVLVWFRQDLRTEDHPALNAAAACGAAVVPVYVWAPEEEGGWDPGGASRWWLHESLRALDAQLRRCGSRLILRCGPALTALRSLVKHTGAGRVFWSSRYEPAARACEKRVRLGLEHDGVETRAFPSGLLFEPDAIRSRCGRPFQVFTPFWRACLAEPEPDEPCPAPKRLRAPRKWPESLALTALGLEPKPDWTEGLRAVWRPGEAGAVERLEQFLDEALAEYATGRDRPDLAGTSRLSPHLHHGEISPRQVWHAVRRHAMEGARRATHRGEEAYLRQLGWREFGHHLLWHFPRTPSEPLRESFAAFPWREDAAALRAWQRGRTGYPLVDAGMRELWATGWMHNRARMVAASFLVKHLLLPWQVGARWFWDILVDADLANNTLGWQWAAGCGADAAPYFRILSPVLQGARFDPQGEYVRRWIPPLARVPNRWVHGPWLARGRLPGDGGLELGREYPQPCVEHRAARERALAAFAEVKMATDAR